MSELYVKDKYSEKKYLQFSSDKDFLEWAEAKDIEAALDELMEFNGPSLMTLCYTDDMGADHWRTRCAKSPAPTKGEAFLAD